ncbi:hypothetical protein RhiTH_005617 [Rhizoctonia solani]
MSPYSTSSAASSQTAVAEPQAQLLEHSGSALKASKSHKKSKTPQEWSPELRQAVAHDIDDFFGGPEPVKVKKPKPAVPKAPRADRGHSASNSLGTALPPSYELPSHLAPVSKPRTIARPDPEPTIEPLPKEIEAGYGRAPSEAYKRAEYKLLRHTELVWARRCLIAAITFVLVVIVIIVGTRVAGIGAFASSDSKTMPRPIIG